MTWYAAAILTRLRLRGPHTYRELATALDLPLPVVVDAIQALKEHRHIEPAGAGGWKTRTRGTT